MGLVQNQSDGIQMVIQQFTESNFAVRTKPVAPKQQAKTKETPTSTGRGRTNYGRTMALLLPSYDALLGLVLLITLTLKKASALPPTGS
jgi:hypothetical protein